MLSVRFRLPLASGIHVIRSVGNRQVVRALIQQFLVLRQRFRKEQDHVGADVEQVPVPEQGLVILPCGGVKAPHGI